MGMMVVLAMTIIQRALGFFRGIWFCRLMDDTVVGGWAMAFDFIIMITPVMLFGMPGSLPRYVETYRQQGHLRSLVRRLLITSIACGGIFLTAMVAFPDFFSWLIFLDANNRSLTHSVAVGVLSIIAFNFVHQLVSSLRQIRIGSLMQFLQSVLFTVIGVAWLMTGGGLEGLILSFAVASLIAILPGAWILWRGWGGLPASDSPFDAPSMWRRLLPYAAALWTMNLLSNLFEMSDRYMILHFTGGGEQVGQAAVGQYHSGRIFPVLLISLATMISGVLLPYLSADWESGHREAVVERLRKILAAVSVIFTVGSATVLLIAPWLFANLLQNRYADGLALMPMAFVFYIWSSLATIGQDYLWVSERGKLVGLAITVGLIVNVILNTLLLPTLGLQGAVIATLCSHAVVLTGVWIAMARCGFRFDLAMILITLLPATLLLGPVTALICMMLTIAASSQLKAWLVEGVDIGVAKLARRNRELQFKL
ncbi:MurJ-like flippase [Novipirellula artificiosorum]|uniref:MurJ-like flippase n=2 Tax=Novipirellula artificiosorum TaxID=2528016 RepID=A0A5C6DNR2_9BACT|nr:MurJ-like flippase [Novipirellula artificiosorum]